MLLSKIPCLDKGYVALIDSCMTTQTLRDVGSEFFYGEYPISLEQLGSMTIAMKCPLFVQLNLSKFNFRIINADNSTTIEAFKPNSAQIGKTDRSTAEVIADDISRTTDALLINPVSYQADGADKFISQIITPLNIYTTLIVSGSYKDWSEFAYLQKNAPGPINAYMIVVQQLIESEWK